MRIWTFSSIPKMTILNAKNWFKVVNIPFFNGLVGKESSWFCGQRNWEVSRETWVQFQQGAETLWSSWAIVCEPGIIKLGTAYICKICHYIDSCIFCIYSACFELFSAYFWAYLCIFSAYFLHIWYVEVYVMAYFMHILCLFYAYFEHVVQMICICLACVCIFWIYILHIWHVGVYLV